jgi:hypothetical protein
MSCSPTHLIEGIDRAFVLSSSISPFVAVGCFDQIQFGDVLKALCESGHG